jgi:hypothetical protein
MQLQFGLFDYIIIAVFYGLAGAVLILTWLFLRRWKYWPAVIFPLAVVAVVLPWAEEVWIAWRFHNLCKDAGVHVYRKVEANGYYDATTTGWSKPEVVTDPRAIAEYEQSGFRFRERNTSVVGHAPGKISHLAKDSDGSWRVSVIEKPTARYHYKHSYQPSPNVYEQPMGWGIEKKELIVVDSETGETIARDLGYNRRSSWIQRIWIGLIGSDLVQCPDPGKGPPREYLPDAAVKPILAK